MGKTQKRLRQGLLAWILVLAMVLAGVSLPGNVGKAQAGEVTLSTDQTSADDALLEKNQYGDDYIKDVMFGIPDVAGTKSALESNGVKSMEVTLTISNIQGATPSVMLFAQPGQDGNWAWNQSDGQDVVSNRQITLTYDFSGMDWNGGSTMGNLGIRFAGSTEGTKVSYRIQSAKLVTDGSVGGSTGGGTGSGSGESATAEQLKGVTAQLNSLGGNPDWGEYNLSITNRNAQAVEGFLVRIPVIGTATGFQSWGKCAAEYKDGYIIVFHAEAVSANSTYQYSSDDKFGFGGGASLGTPEVLADDGKYTSSNKTNYALTGQKKEIKYEDTPFGKHGKLQLKQVEGYTAPVIVDQHGKPYQLRGASTHGMHWNEMTPFVNKDAFQSLRDEWGVNMVRLVSYVTQGGYTEGAGSLLDTKIQEGVKYAKELGMYVLVDWHIHAENPHTTKAQAEEFFRKYAAMYRDYDNVIFEICNEPTGVEWYNGSGGDLYSYCKDIAGIIRDAGSNALVICGTNTWSQDVEDVAKKPLKDDGFQNILYTFHFYSGSHYNDKMDKVRTATAAGTPIFVTEFGICDASGNGGYDTANADKWIELLDGYNISYACWSLCNKNESASYLLPSCSRRSGWLESDLSKTGIWLVNTYRAHQDKELGVDTSKGEDPGNTSNPGSSSDPGNTNQPGTSSDPGSTNGPGSSSDPGSTNQPGSSSDPGSTNGPGSSSDPGSTNQPGTSSDPGNTNQPGSSSDPGSTNQPGSSSDPGSDQPGTSSDPGSTNQPGASTNPGGSENPGDSGSQGGTDSRVDQLILSQKSDRDIKGSHYAKLALRASKTTKNAITLKWKKVSGADHYLVYGNRCGNVNRLQKLAKVSGTSWTQKKLKKGTYYKYVVVACRTDISGDKAVSIAKTVHAATAGSKKGNAKKIKLNKARIKLKKGKKVKIKAKIVAAPKKAKIAKHRGISYESSNSKVAVVSAGGRVKAVGKGSCNIYVYAQNGVGKKIKVTVN